MKKLVFIIGIVLIGVAIFFSIQNFETTDNQQTTVLTSKIGLGVTLNGVDEITALKMKARFNILKNSDKHPSAESVWISKEEIRDIVSLLIAEREAQKEHRNPNVKDTCYGLTDGIRIYFGCDPLATNLQNTTSILLVSTKDSGDYKDSSYKCASGRNHHDYYNHSLDSSLFKLGSINGEICSGKSDCEGALLYKLICNKCSDDPTCQWSPHNIPVTLARKMVRNFGRDAINTNGEWFDLCMWTTFIKDKNSNGLRIYFGVHPKCKKDANKKDAYESLRNAFVLTPTKYNKQTGTNDDHFDCNSAISYAPNYENFHKNSRYRWILTPGQDNGELCPDVCN